MTTLKTITTKWNPELRLLTTQISGDIEMDDVETWEQSLHDGLKHIEDNSQFKILVNLHEFNATDFDVHKRFRTIVPLTLAEYGWKVGYVNLFIKSALMPIRNTRGIQCVAAAHVHQDVSKIESYEAQFGKETEHFFANPKEAFEWIKNFEISSAN